MLRMRLKELRMDVSPTMATTGAQSPFTLPNEVGETASAGSSYLKSSEEKDISDISSAFGAVGGIIDVVGAIQSLVVRRGFD